LKQEEVYTARLNHGWSKWSTVQRNIYFTNVRHSQTLWSSMIGQTVSCYSKTHSLSDSDGV